MATAPSSAFTNGRFTAFLDDLDDWCGTKPPRHFPPRPKGLRDALIAVVIAELAERVSDARIQGQLKNVAMDLHVSGAKQILG